MTECQEIAWVLARRRREFASMDDAREFVRTQMRSGESETIIDNVAWILYRITTNG